MARSSGEGAVEELEHLRERLRLELETLEEQVDQARRLWLPTEDEEQYRYGELGGHLEQAGMCIVRASDLTGRLDSLQMLAAEIEALRRPPLVEDAEEDVP